MSDPEQEAEPRPNMMALGDVLGDGSEERRGESLGLIGSGLGGGRLGGGGVGLRGGGRSKTASRRKPRRALKRRVTIGRPSLHRPRHIQFSTQRLRHTMHNTARYVNRAPLSTFSMDVDTTSYSRLRGHLKRRELVNPREVKLEGLVNAFPYELDAPAPKVDIPFSVTAELSASPWSELGGGDQLLRVALRARDIHTERAPSNLVFLVDVSGSMRAAGKLSLVKQSLLRLTRQLTPQDQVSVVTYSGEVKTLLSPTRADRRGKRKIKRAIRRLRAAGKTAGGAGLKRAYEVVRSGWIAQDHNRVIMTTDGDFNVGIASVDEIKSFISAKRETGAYLSVVGFGYKGYNDENMGALACSGNGNYAFINSVEESERVFGRELDGLLSAVATDFKIQVEFNPNHVTRYRLLGYKKRRLSSAAFSDDTRDSAELGSGQQVTALYELWTPYVPPKIRVKLKYPCGDSAVAEDVDCPDREGDEQRPEPDLTRAREWATIKVRYKPSVDAASALSEYPVVSVVTPLMESSLDQRVATTLALLAEGLSALSWTRWSTRGRLSRREFKDMSLFSRKPYTQTELQRLIKPQAGEEVSARRRSALRELQQMIRRVRRAVVNQ